MRILAVSDVESKRYYEYYQKGSLDSFDLILSCGDLHPEYLEFLVTMAHCPLLYVHGNHDDRYGREPDGCICVDDKLYVCKGLRIVGLGGSCRYRDGKYMYTEHEMKRRIFRLGYRLRRSGGFDILLTHAPVRGLGDLEDLPHRAPQLRPRDPAEEPLRRHRGHQRLRLLRHRDPLTKTGACAKNRIDFSVRHGIIRM